MKENSTLKWQLYLAIIFTYLLIIGTAVYFISGLDQQVERMGAVESHLQLKQGSTHEFDNLIHDLNQSSEILKTRTYFLISLLIVILLFILDRIVKIIKELQRRSTQTERLNEEIKAQQAQIEGTNWALGEAIKLNDEISGLDNINEVTQVGFDSILASVDCYAAALYVRSADTDEFLLKQHIGIDKKSTTPESFREGEGLMGRAVKDQQRVVLKQEAEMPLHSSSTLAGNQIKNLLLIPCVQGNETFGLLEVGGDYAENDLPKILDYLSRSARNIAIAIKSGQAHNLVRNLLEETQQQTEELEAQQEELRITNEELIYKTNLLEASEEELRVQQEELQQTNLELEKKAKQLELRNDELDNSRKIVEEKIQEVEQASKYKSEFMANMSHELRTPLNSILILAKLLQDNKPKNLHADQVKYASVIHSAGNDLLELINELLDLAKIEAGKIELNEDSINIQAFNENIEGLFATMADKKEIDFVIDVDASVPSSFVCDEYRLEQVIKNFLSNAFKFTDSKGRIALSITRDGEQLKFAVSDTGKGISPEKQQLIFEAFRQEDGSTSRKYGGTGLGLTISREIAYLLGGNITLNSELDKGSTFTLSIPYIATGTPVVHSSEPILQKQTLPLVEIEKSSVQPTPDIIAEQHKAVKTLLIVEDDINFAEILREFAEAYGFEVILAHNGADGVQKAQQVMPHAIILDVMLPISDGWEVLRTLKADPSTKQIPIHMMSAANFNQRDFIDRGAIGFLSKPVSEDALRKTFENIQLSIAEGIQKVLLIEDQEFQSDVIKSAFAEQNIHVIQAFSAASALIKLEEEPNIDCIILDIKLPDANGLDLLDRIHAMPDYTETPIIINTAYDLSAEQIERIQLHTKAMVLKSDKSNSRLIDEVTLFLNKISSDDYSVLSNNLKIPTKHPQTGGLEGKRVLIADDDMRNVFALTTALQEFNMEIEIANNGLEAVDIATQGSDKIDIILMDIMMPEMDGYEAIQKIRQDRAHANTPIIAVTAKAMKGDREKSIQIGASDYVSKPIDMDKLISLMRVWLS